MILAMHRYESAITFFVDSVSHCVNETNSMRLTDEITDITSASLAARLNRRALANNIFWKVCHLTRIYLVHGVTLIGSVTADDLKGLAANMRHLYRLCGVELLRKDAFRYFGEKRRWCGNSDSSDVSQSDVGKNDNSIAGSPAEFRVGAVHDYFVDENDDSDNGLCGSVNCSATIDNHLTDLSANKVSNDAAVDTSDFNNYIFPNADDIFGYSLDSEVSCMNDSAVSDDSDDVNVPGNLHCLEKLPCRFNDNTSSIRLPKPFNELQEVDVQVLQRDFSKMQEISSSNQLVRDSWKQVYHLFEDLVFVMVARRDREWLKQARKLRKGRLIKMWGARLSTPSMPLVQLLS